MACLQLSCSKMRVNSLYFCFYSCISIKADQNIKSKGCCLALNNACIKLGGVSPIELIWLKTCPHFPCILIMFWVLSLFNITRYSDEK